jgi:hypothetical protein
LYSVFNALVTQREKDVFPKDAAVLTSFSCLFGGGFIQKWLAMYQGNTCAVMGLSKVKSYRQINTPDVNF